MTPSWKPWKPETVNQSETSTKQKKPTFGSSAQYDFLTGACALNAPAWKHHGDTGVESGKFKIGKGVQTSHRTPSRQNLIKTRAKTKSKKGSKTDQAGGCLAVPGNDQHARRVAIQSVHQARTGSWRVKHDPRCVVGGE